MTNKLEQDINNAAPVQLYTGLEENLLKAKLDLNNIIISYKTSKDLDEKRDLSILYGQKLEEVYILQNNYYKMLKSIYEK